MEQKIKDLTIRINGLIDQLMATRGDLYESSEQTNGCDDIWEVTLDDVFLKKGVYLVTYSINPKIEDRKEPIWLLPSIQGMTFSDKRYKGLRGMPVGSNSPWHLHTEKSPWKQNYLHIFKTKRKIKLVPFTFHGSWWGSYPKPPPDLIDPEFLKLSTPKPELQRVWGFNPGYIELPGEKLRDYSQEPVTKYELLKDIYHLYPPGPNSDKLDFEKWNQIFNDFYYNRELLLRDYSSREDIGNNWFLVTESDGSVLFSHNELSPKGREEPPSHYFKSEQARTHPKLLYFTEKVQQEYKVQGYTGMTNSREVIIFDWTECLKLVRIVKDGEGGVEECK